MTPPELIRVLFCYLRLRITNVFVLAEPARSVVLIAISGATKLRINRWLDQPKLVNGPYKFDKPHSDTPSGQNCPHIINYKANNIERQFIRPPK